MKLLFSFPVRLVAIFFGTCLLSSPSLWAQDASDRRVDIGGYGSFRLDASDARNTDPSFTLRRFVVTTDARIGERVRIYSEIEYERLGEIEVERSAKRSAGGLTFEQELEGTNGSEIALEQAWGEYRFSENWGLRFGAVLPPVGRFNTRHDDNLWNFTRRSLIDRAAEVLPGSAAWTEMGIGFRGQTDLESGVHIEYEAYLLTGTTLDFAIEQKIQTRNPKRNKLELEAVVSPTQGAFDGSNPADAGAFRLSVSPALGSEFALSGYAGQYTPEFLDTRESMFTLGFDGEFKLGAFLVEGEFLYTEYTGVDRALDSFATAALDHATETSSSETADLESEIEIELKGLSDRRYGFWLDMSRPIALKRGSLGLDDALLTPVLRYERAWIDNEVSEFDFSGGLATERISKSRQQDRVSIGLTFRPVPGSVFQLIYSRSNPIDGAILDPINGSDGTLEVVNSVSFGLAVGF